MKLIYLYAIFFFVQYFQNTILLQKFKISGLESMQLASRDFRPCWIYTWVYPQNFFFQCIQFKTSRSMICSLLVGSQDPMFVALIICIQILRNNNVHILFLYNSGVEPLVPWEGRVRVSQRSRLNPVNPFHRPTGLCESNHRLEAGVRAEWVAASNCRRKGSHPSLQFHEISETRRGSDPDLFIFKWPYDLYVILGISCYRNI